MLYHYLNLSLSKLDFSLIELQSTNDVYYNFEMNILYFLSAKSIITLSKFKKLKKSRLTLHILYYLCVYT